MPDKEDLAARRELLLERLERLLKCAVSAMADSRPGQYDLCPSRLRTIRDKLAAAEDDAWKSWVVRGAPQFLGSGEIGELELQFWGSFLAYLICVNGPLAPRSGTYDGEMQNIELAARVVAAFSKKGSYDDAFSFFSREIKAIWELDKQDVKPRIFAAIGRYNG